MRVKNLLVILIIFGLLFTGTVAYMDNETEDTTAEDAATVVDEGTDTAAQPVEFDEAAYLGKMKKVAENDKLIMYFNEESTEVAVKSKKTGTVWYTNPPNRDQDPLAGGVNKLKLGSQLSISYFTEASQQKIMDNYNDSISRGQFEVQNIDNGIKVVYTIGKVEDLLIIPEVISAERFEEVLGKIADEKDKRNVERRYGLVSLQDAKNDTEKQDLLTQYPVLEDHDIYRLRTSANRFVLEEIEKIFAATGYTLDDMNRDHQENSVPPKEANKELFTIPIEYTLDNDNLVVNVPTNEIKYDETFPLTNIKLLEYFGAADQTQEGYIFVPDGSGSLIHLNNGRNQERPFISQVYGRDKAIKIIELFENTEQSYLPVYGMKQGDKAFFAIIEDGDAFGTILADVAGRVNSYNTVCTEFNSLPNDTLDLGEVSGNNTIKIYQPRMYEGSFKVRYAFLDGEDANYVGMANYYRDYLVKKGDMKKLQPKENIPFYLDVVGAIDKVKPFMGIPVNSYEVLTTYKEAEKIAQKLVDNDVSNIKMKYTGWLDGGIKHFFAAKAKPMSKLGGSGGFKDLVKFAKDNNIELYPDQTFQYVYREKMFDGFSSRSDASRFINKEVALIYDFNIATFLDKTYEAPYFMVSPTKIGSEVDSFIKQYKRYDNNGVSLKTMGNDLNSNFREKHLMDRQQSLNIMKDQVKKFKDQGMNVMLNGGNAYAIPYVDSIINLPTDGNSFNIADESIPFYQLVVRGYVEYAGEPINLATDYKRAMLKTIETGGGVYFKWIYRENSLVKNSDYEYLYSVNYENWMKDAVEFYQEANSVLKDVQDQRIVAHESLGKGVYQVTYEKGKSIIVNYNKKPVTIKGVTIDAESYHVFQEVKGK